MSSESARPSATSSVRVLRPELHEDERGWLFEIVNRELGFEPRQVYAVDIVTAAESAVRVREAMRDLPAEQLEVVRLSFIEGAAHSEIANRLDVPLGTVKSRLRLAMRRMRKSLEDFA